MQSTVIDQFINTPANDQSLSVMINDLENQCFPQQQQYSNRPMNPSDAAAFMDSSYYAPSTDPLYDDFTMTNADSYYTEGIDFANVDVMPSNFQPITKFPFKPSSPYYQTFNDASYYNMMTVSPQDSLIKHETDYPVMSNLQDFTFQPSAVYEHPEPMDEDEDDENSEDEMEFVAQPTSEVPGLRFSNQQAHMDVFPSSAPVMSNVPVTPEHPLQQTKSLDSNLPTPSPSPMHPHKRAPLNDQVKTPTTSGRTKRIPLSQTGPHRCDQINNATGEPCNKIFSRPYDLIRHQDTIHAAVRKTFKCDLCVEQEKSFSRMDALSRHMRIKHNC